MRPRHTPPPRWWAHPDTWLWAAGSLTFLSAYMGVAYGSVHALALPADDHGSATPQAVATDWTWDTTSAPMTTVATPPSSVYASAVVTGRASVSRACRCAPRQPVATTSLAATAAAQTTTAQTTTAPASISPHTTPPRTTAPRSTRTTTTAASTPPTTTAPSSSAPSSTAATTPTTFQASDTTTAATSSSVTEEELP